MPLLHQSKANSSSVLCSRVSLAGQHRLLLQLRKRRPSRVPVCSLQGAAQSIIRDKQWAQWEGEGKCAWVCGEAGWKSIHSKHLWMMACAGWFKCAAFMNMPPGDWKHLWFIDENPLWRRTLWIFSPSVSRKQPACITASDQRKKKKIKMYKLKQSRH